VVGREETFVCLPVPGDEPTDVHSETGKRNVGSLPEFASFSQKQRSQSKDQDTFH